MNAPNALSCRSFFAVASTTAQELVRGRRLSLLLASAVCIAGFGGPIPAFAQDESLDNALDQRASTKSDAAAPKGRTAEARSVAAEGKKEEKVQTGVIARSGKFGQSLSITDIDTSGTVPGGDASAISGSVSRSGPNSCVARVVNTGTQRYSVSYAVVAKTRSGSTQFRRTFSKTLAPQQSDSQTINGCSSDLNLQVELSSARPLGK